MWKKILKGIVVSERAFCGPRIVQLDLTDRCNNSCIACWVHSPSVDRKEVFPNGQKELPFKKVKEIIRELARLGTKEIILSGSGEPLIYPQIFDLIKLVKSKGMHLNIITNATLLNDSICEILVKTKVDLLTVSIWAGSPKAYVATHPIKTEKDFVTIKRNLKKLAEFKQKLNSFFPYIKIYNVVCSKNYNDIKEMVDFGKYTNANSIEFQVVDIIKGKTDVLALDNSMKEKIFSSFEKIMDREDFVKGELGVAELRLVKDDYDEKDFGKIWKNYRKDFVLLDRIVNIVCPKGRYPIGDANKSIKVSTSHFQDTRFRFLFDWQYCKKCANFLDCFPSKKLFIDIDILNLLGIKSFIRRVFSQDAEQGIYKQEINQIPCYMGWYYARILTNGDIIPCCKASLHPLGNIHNASFSQIWNCPAYNEFRFKAKNLPKSDPYFSKIECLKSCDNWGMNLEIDAKFKTFQNNKYSYFKTVKEQISKIGLKKAITKVVHHLRPKNFKDRYLEILGIYDGKRGYKGPFHVQIDLTNNCNNTCIACWCNSPLLKEKRLSGEKKRQYLPLEMVRESLDEISHMGATEVYYSGSGEPFMHPQIMEVLEYTKKKNLVCHVNTNFTLLNKERLDHLVNIGVDFLTISTWSATADTYVKTHPNRSKEDFYKIKENLTYLNTYKKDKPHIKLYNVLFNLNYFEVEKMVDFAKETRSESLEYTLIDTIPDATDVLSLNEKQISELRELCENIKSKLDNCNRVKDTDVLIFQFEQFLRRISVSSDAKEAMYDRNIIDSMPCYIGWLFARIIPNGEVHSCLKAHRIPTGSLYLNRFSEIWNSKKQSYFRKKTLVYEKKDQFFKLIGNDPNIKDAGCYKSCDDIGRNTWMHNRMKMLTLPERVVLGTVAKSLRVARKIRAKEENHHKYHRDPVIAGVLHGRKAFAGPEQVVIDLTNRCNLRCTTCWLYSPHLNENKSPDEWLKKELSKDALIRLIDDLSSLGTKRIRFTGGGEPLAHKDFMEIVEYARNKGLLVVLTTNFTLATKEKIFRLMNLGLEELCVSIWASNPETYSLVHQGTPTNCFEQLKDSLCYLKEIKKGRPRLTFANVIMNNNYRDFQDMYEFGKKYGADSIYYTLADVFAGQTDRFLLSQEERQDLLGKARRIKERNKGESIQLEYFDGFLRRISGSQSDFEKGEFDKADINKVPCYVGWIFSRILADGSVAPCCRAVRKIMGNINETPFREIWFSEIYNGFRSKAKYASKDNPYFKDVGCVKECDNLMHNEGLHKRMG